MKTASILVGCLAIAVGLLWVGQGLGVIRWPASSVMVDERPWAMRGAAVGIAGALLVLWARRR
ncbi:MAG TPA: hypothetical protein VEZ48_00420 [Sphingomonadaceae bacterium]|nr:hypothetical protein [Sphingomonadaceae bacterium]